MKILFIGTVKFSKIALQKLIELNAQVVGVCTKEKSEFNSDFAELRPLCEKNKIPYKYVDNINSKDSFTPNTIVDISKFLNKKIQIMKIYKSEINKHPSPRSEKSIRALATFRGSTAGYNFAESFMLLKEII